MVHKPFPAIDSLLANSNLCPDCMGKGRILRPTRVEPRDEQGLQFIDCPRCHGTGFERTL